MDQKLLAYIIKQIDLGRDADKIKQALVNLGNNETIVEEHVVYAIRLINFVEKNIDLDHDTDKIKKVLFIEGYDAQLVEEYVDNIVKAKKIKNKITIIASLIVITIIVLSGLFLYKNYLSNNFGEGSQSLGNIKQQSDETKANSKTSTSTPTTTSASTTSTSTTTTSVSTTSTIGPTTTQVLISGFQFIPAGITINVGDTVVWTNKDSAQHTVESSDNTFKSGVLSNGDTYSFTFTNAGSHNYICGIHPSMHGSVTVQ